MATGYGSPVSFTKEKNVWNLFGAYSVGSGGVLNVATVPISNAVAPINKGIANVWSNTPTFTAVTSSGSSTITSVSSFLGLFSGMALTGPGVTTTIGTITPSTGSIVLGTAAITMTGSTGAAMVASGGQYIIQFGVQSNVGSITQFARLDTYNRLLDFNVSFDCSVSSAIGTATQQALFPNVGQVFVIQNLITQKTVPATSTSNSTDASLVVQFGNGVGTAFVPAVLAPGMLVRAGITLGNTTSL